MVTPTHRNNISLWIIYITKFGNCKQACWFCRHTPWFGFGIMIDNKLLIHFLSCITDNVSVLATWWIRRRVWWIQCEHTREEHWRWTCKKKYQHTTKGSGFTSNCSVIDNNLLYLLSGSKSTECGSISGEDLASEWNSWKYQSCDQCNGVSTGCVP